VEDDGRKVRSKASAMLNGRRLSAFGSRRFVTVTRAPNLAFPPARPSIRYNRTGYFFLYQDTLTSPKFSFPTMADHSARISLLGSLTRGLERG